MISPIDLKYFLEVARIGHVSRAADRLGITQPALSHCLKRMESSMGRELFMRSKKGVTLTSAGQILASKAEELAQQWDSLLDSVHEDTEKVSGRIRLGCHTAVAQYTLPEILPYFLAAHPLIQLSLVHGLSRHLTEQVVSSQLDVALAINPTPHPDLVIRELLRDQVTLWKIAHGKNDDVLLVEPSLMQSQDILRKLESRKIHFSRKIESSSLEVLSQLLVAGCGRAILPSRVVRAISSEKIRAVEGAPVLQDRLCLLYKKEFTKTARGRALVNEIIERLKNSHLIPK